MKSAAKPVRNQLEWSVLEVDPEEWDRRMADLGVAAAANGFPFLAATAQTPTNGDGGPAAASNVDRLRIGRYCVLAGLAVLILAMLVGYTVWRTAQAGIVRMQGDVANAVTLETIKTHGKRPERKLHESVQSVEFLGDKAMAAVVVTRTLPSGKVLVQAEARFYQQTPTGWQHTEPLAAFWGPIATMDTESLHFVFGEKDRSVVEEIAPAAEAHYATLRRATGEDPAAGGLFTVEIVPGFVAGNALVEDGRIRLTSPLLYRATPLSGAEALTLLLRRSFADQMFSAALRRTTVKAQWLTLMRAFGTSLAFSDAIQPAATDQLAALRRLRFLAYGSLPLGDLQDSVVRYDRATPSTPVYYQPGNSYELEQRAAVAEQLIGFIAATYGIDVLPKLLHGFAQYDDWDTLAPNVLGVSAEELEAAWQAAHHNP